MFKDAANIQKLAITYEMDWHTVYNDWLYMSGRIPEDQSRGINSPPAMKWYDCCSHYLPCSGLLEDREDIV